MLLSFVAATILFGQSPAKRPPILTYIKQTWTTLTRSDKDLAKAVVDPKFQADKDRRWPLYISRSEDAQLVEEGLRRDMPAAGFKTISIKQLPEDLDALKQQGLLYLPKAYVVPGGRFNEMYGWDSYFIQVGLLKDNETQLAKDMADNFLYQVKNYGKVLNANRTYYLNRSQPPFLTQMVLGVFAKTHDHNWLADALPSIEKYYQLWATEPHSTPDTGLARYWDFGEGPAPEVLSAEKDIQGRTHYDLVREYFRTHAVNDYRLNQYYDKKTDQLTALFYKGDRSMRESGFDPSNRFGPFNIDIIHYNPVCLNSLLYLMEMQTAEILTTLDRKQEAANWQAKAEGRAAAINKLMWDEKDGLYYDYDFEDKHVRHYPFLTTFYPLWAGIASKEQAARVVKNLPLFEKVGGLQTSTDVSGNQWDSPFGWAPLEMIAVEGLRRYGYNADAERISMKFLSLVTREYERTGYIVEKYDVVNGGSNVSAIHFGYSANQVGFGWTNAVFLELLSGLTKEDREKLLAK
jgi:alpha,alpha-trehalase